jgi:hypothetical protein
MRRTIANVVPRRAAIVRRNAVIPLGPLCKGVVSEPRPRERSSRPLLYGRGSDLPIIFAGSTKRSNSSAEINPPPIAASRSVVFSASAL